MAPQQQPKPAAQRAATFRTKPGKGEVKVSVLNIRGPYSADTIRPANIQPAPSSVPVRTSQPPASHVRAHSARGPVTSGTVSKQRHRPPTMLQMGSCFNKDNVSTRTGASTQHLIGHSPGLRPLCLGGVSGSALRECLIISSLHHQIKKTTPGEAV